MGIEIDAIVHDPFIQGAEVKVLISRVMSLSWDIIQSSLL
jgi:hypothetical protein